MKIVYCINRLFYIGGTETVTLFKASALARDKKNSVWIIYTEEKGSATFDSSPFVQFLDLEIRYSNNTWHFPWNMVRIGFKRILHKRRLSRALSHIHPDIVISTGFDEFRLLPRIKGPWKTLRELHSTKNFKYLNAQTFRDRFIAKIGEWIDYERTIKQYDHIVILTQEEMSLHWSDWKNVSVIPNPVRFRLDRPSPLSAKRIIAVGRLSYEKNFSSLIRAFALVHPHFPDWSLDIIGAGAERDQLLSEIQRLNLSECVHLPGATMNVMKEMVSSSLLVCSSLYEGFSLALTEAQSCGLPVVSYDCPCGPKDLISDGNNGFLVPLGDEAALADRISQILGSTSLRRRMGALAWEKSKAFDISDISNQWLDLFEMLITN